MRLVQSPQRFSNRPADILAFGKLAPEMPRSNRPADIKCEMCDYAAEPTPEGRDDDFGKLAPEMPRSNRPADILAFGKLASPKLSPISCTSFEMKWSPNFPATARKSSKRRSEDASPEPNTSKGQTFPVFESIFWVHGWQVSLK